MPLGYAVSRILDFCPHLTQGRVESRLQYASFACVDRGLLYIEVPKAASTAIKTFLRSLYTDAPLQPFIDDSRETRMEMFIHSRMNIPIPPLTLLSNEMQRELFESPDVLRFTVVRNPYLRLISAWRDKVLLREPTVEWVQSSEGDVTFTEFIAHIERAEYLDDHWARQVDLCFPGAIPFTHIGKLETLSKTSDAIASHLNAQVVFPNENSGGLRLHTAVSRRLRARIAALYAEDFTVLGYDPSDFPKPSRNSTVKADAYIREIAARNLVIAHLYAERDRLRGELKALGSAV
jgi:sulfotransferase famil protein